MKATNKKMMVLLAAMATISSSTFAAGVNNTVTGDFGSEAFGKDNKVTATSAFTVGFKNEVSGANSLVYGHKNKATGANSFAGGENSEAKSY